MITPPAGAAEDRAVDAAVEASCLHDLPTVLVQQVLADAVLIQAPAGSIVRREGQAGPHLELMLSGLIRLCVAAPDGRQLTIRYARAGAMMGTLSLFAPGYTMPGSIQALTESELLSLRPATVHDLARGDLMVARALLVELSDRLYAFVGEIHDSVFATIRQRVARHLLDLASEYQTGTELIAPISQPELAAAVGSVREVVARVLREFRNEGLVEPGRDSITLKAPERLLAEIYPGVLRPDPPASRSRLES